MVKESQKIANKQKSELTHTCKFKHSDSKRLNKTQSFEAFPKNNFNKNAYHDNDFKEKQKFDESCDSSDRCYSYSTMNSFSEQFVFEKFPKKTNSAKNKNPFKNFINYEPYSKVSQK